MSLVQRFRSAIIVGAIAWLLIGGYMSYAFVLNDAGAQEATVIGFSVSWEPAGDFYADGDACRHTPFPGDVVFNDAPASVSGFTDVVTIRDAGHAIVSMTPLIGTISSEEVSGVISMLCNVPISAEVQSSTGYTVWFEDTYIASIPADGSLDDDAFILLSE